MDKKKYWFFGSKLNSVLLLILIILMIIAIHIMLQNKEMYFGVFEKQVPKNNIEQPQTKNEILGHKDNLVSFSILPDQKVHGIVSYQGVVKGGYFFEGNILINVLDINNTPLKKDHATATTEWTTAGPVSFKGTIDFTGLPKGQAQLEIKNDNPSDLPQNDSKSILIPIVIE